MIAYGLAVLRLPPDQFWALTPCEFAAMLPVAPVSPVPGRGGLAAMMQAHPDLVPDGDQR